MNIFRAIVQFFALPASEEGEQLSPMGERESVAEVWLPPAEERQSSTAEKDHGGSKEGDRYASTTAQVKSTTPKQIARRIVLALLIIAAASGLAVILLVQKPFQFSLLHIALLSSLAAAILEELIFRGGLFPLLNRAFAYLARENEEEANQKILHRENGDNKLAASSAKPIEAGSHQPPSSTPSFLWKAAWVQAFIFGLIHLGGVTPDALTWVIALQAMAKVASAFFFGVCMAALYVTTRNLFACMATHFAFNLLSLVPQELMLGITQTYLTGIIGDLLICAMGALALTLPFLWARKLLP